MADNSDFGVMVAGLKSLSKQVKINSLNGLNEYFSAPDKNAIVFDANIVSAACNDVVCLMTDPSESVQEKSLNVFSTAIVEDIQIDGTLPNLFSLLRFRLGNFTET